MSTFEFRDKTVVITGAGKGLGYALSEAFAQKNAQVIAISRSIESLEPLSAKHQGRLICHALDVTDHLTLQHVIDETVERTGGIDVLFNNAAVYPKVNFLDENITDWLTATMINLGGPAICCKAVLPHMIESGYGRIYNIGSWADLDPAPRSSAYAASKGGLHALTKSIAKDIAHLNLDIEVHEWIPGHLNTQMSDFTGIDPAQSAQWAIQMVQSNASSKNTIFENDKEWFPPKGLRSRIKDRLFFWR